MATMTSTSRAAGLRRADAGASSGLRPRPCAPTTRARPLLLRHGRVPRATAPVASASNSSVGSIGDPEAARDNASPAISVLGWSKVLPVAGLWTNVFIEYYAQGGEGPGLVAEFMYFWTMLYSAVQCVSDASTFGVVASQAPKSRVLGAIAGRVVTRQGGSRVLGEGETWGEVAEAWGKAEEDLSLLYVWNFGVASTDRKRGIGQQVMEWLQSSETSRARVEGVDGIFLFVYRTNRPAIMLYEKLGYEVVASWQDPKWLKQAEKNLTGVERKILMIKKL